LRNNLKAKEKLEKSANGGVQLKIKMERALIWKWWYRSRAMKIHILYTVGKSTDRRTQREEELAKWLSGLGENWRKIFWSKNEIEQSEP
jgi:hypothetical protein